MLDYLCKQLDESEKICERYNNFYTEYNRLKKENDLLKEELKELKEGIQGIYNNMVSLEIINKHEMEEVEEI